MWLAARDTHVCEFDTHVHVNTSITRVSYFFFFFHVAIKVYIAKRIWRTRQVYFFFFCSLSFGLILFLFQDVRAIFARTERKLKLCLLHVSLNCIAKCFMSYVLFLEKLRITSAIFVSQELLIRKRGNMVKIEFYSSMSESEWPWNFGITKKKHDFFPAYKSFSSSDSTKFKNSIRRVSITFTGGIYLGVKNIHFGSFFLAYHCIKVLKPQVRPLYL